jgi:hypothetical protein
MIAYQLALRAVRQSFSVSLAIVAVTCIVSAARADDDDIVNANGFELPFSTLFLGGTGQLEGQVNPPGEGQIIPPGQWLRTQGSGASTARVQSAVVASGLQAVRVDRVAFENPRWAVPVNHLGYPDYPNPFPPEPQQPFICISWDMRVEQAQGSALEVFGPFFGVEAYDDDGNEVGLLGSLGVDATTGDVLYQAPGTGFLTETGSTVNFGQWNRFAIELDYSTDTYKAFLNFAPLGTFGFVDPGLNQFSDADIAALAAAGDQASQALAGTAYFDNFLVREGICPPIPEPATLGLAAVGFMGAVIRRRARRTMAA